MVIYRSAVDHSIIQGSAGPLHVNTSPVVRDETILNKDLRVCHTQEVDAISNEIVNRCSSNRHTPTTNDLDTVHAGPQTFNIEAIQQNIICRATFTVMPFEPETRTPASMWSEIILIDFVIVTAPKPPGSST